MADCTLVVLCDKGVMLATTATYSANLFYLTVLNALSIFKYKVRGFTLYLLIGIQVLMIAALVQAVMLTRIKQLVDNDMSAEHMQ